MYNCTFTTKVGKVGFTTFPTKVGLPIKVVFTIFLPSTQYIAHQ